MSTSPTTKQAFNHLTSLATEISEWAKTERNLDESSDWMKAVAHAAALRTAIETFTLANWADLDTEYRFGEPTATCIQPDGTRIAYDLNVPRHSWL